MRPLGPSRNRRRLFAPLLILIVGGALAIWASQGQSQRLEAIDRTVRELCASAAAGDEVMDRLPAAEPFLARAVSRLLSEACAGLADDPDALEVFVSTGDAPMFSDGSATHTALIRIAGVDRLGLRFAFDEQGPLIVGYWLPVEQARRVMVSVAGQAAPPHGT